MNLTAIPPKVWKTDLEEFREKTRAFYAGEMDKGAYKSFSGYYGSYAQKGGKANMLRLRMPAGQVTKERMAFTAHVVKKYKIVFGSHKRAEANAEKAFVIFIAFPSYNISI
jgi:ferredoxin-nitrite reductase